MKKNRKKLTRAVVLAVYIGLYYGTANAEIIDDSKTDIPLQGSYTNINIEGTKPKNITLDGTGYVRVLNELTNSSSGEVQIYNGGKDIALITKYLINNGNLTLNNKEFFTHYGNWDYNKENGIANTSGTLTFVCDRIETDRILNKEGATIYFKGANLRCAQAFDDSGRPQYAVSVTNEGTMELDTYFLYDSTTPIRNEKTGVMRMNKTVALIQGRANYPEYYYRNVIENRGDLRIKPDNGAMIYGNIAHYTVDNAHTEIVLKNDSSFRGDINIIGDDDGDFSLTLEDNATWYPSSRSGVVNNVRLNGGTIDVAPINFNTGGGMWFPGYYYWPTTKLHLRNFETNGSGVIRLYTDLEHDAGNCVVFQGKMPENPVRISIHNNGNHGGVPITREDGHSVTIVESEGAITLGETDLSFYGYVYGSEDSKAYFPIIDDIAADDGTHKFNFVGWTSMKEDGGKEKHLHPETQHGNDKVVNGEDVDTVFRRLYDLRTDPSEVGVWIRGEKSRMKIKDIGYDVGVMGGGHDWHIENEARRLYYGLGLSYTTSGCDDNVIGDAKGMGYNLYGSWMGKKNKDYVDVILKYGRLHKDYGGIDQNNIFVSGNYKKNLTALALKYGRRIPLANEAYIEPQLGYTLGIVGSADYTDNWGTSIHADNTTSHIMSVGAQVGKNIKGTELYGRLSYVYDFDGKIDVSAPGIHVTDDMGGGYVRAVIGASRKIDANNSFYLDIGRDFGNKVEKPYAVSLGYRHTF